MKTFVVCLCLFSFLGASVAQADPPAVAPTPSVTPVAALMKGEPAPFNGLLLPEPRFRDLLQKENALDYADGKFDIEHQLRLNQAQIYQQEMKDCNKTVPWYKTASANRWFGFTAGIMLSALAIYGGATAVKTAGR